MNNRNKALDLVEIIYEASDAIGTAEAEAEDLTLSLEGLIALRNYVDSVSQAAKLMKHALENVIAKELGPNGAIRYGDSFIRSGSRKIFHVTEPEALKEFVMDCGIAGLDIFSMSAVKVGTLKKLAEARGLTPAAAVDSFGEYVEDDSVLTVMPIEKAPQWAQKLESGQRSFPKGKTLEEAVQP